MILCINIIIDSYFTFSNLPFLTIISKGDHILILILSFITSFLNAHKIISDSKQTEFILYKRDE